MYARLVRFSLKPDKHASAVAIADELPPQISVQPGCQGVTVFGTESDGEYGIFVLWDSVEHANAAAEIIRPILDQHLAGNVQAPPYVHLFDVLSK